MIVIWVKKKKNLDSIMYKLEGMNLDKRFFKEARIRLRYEREKIFNLFISRKNVKVVK